MIKWNTIKSHLPMDGVIVLLAETNTTDIKDAEIGRIINNNLNQQGWLIGNNGKTIALSSLQYWAFIEEKELSIPDVSDEELQPALVQMYNKLFIYEKKLQLLGKHMVKSGRGIYPLDYFVSGILNRAISLISGFQLLLKTSNFLAGSHLVRPHLDNYLRLSAAWLVDDPHDFATKVWGGDPINKMKDRNNNTMTDAHLKSIASVEYPWIEDVYTNTSGYVHYSRKHIINATRLKKDLTLMTYIGGQDFEVTNEERINAVACMIEISNCITQIVYGWIETKRIKG